MASDGRKALFRRPVPVLLALVLATAACAESPRSRTPSNRPMPSNRHTVRPSAQGPAPVRRTVLLGRSVLGRSIVAIELGDPSSPRKVMVVGCIHGNEAAGIAVTRALADGPAPANADLWLVPVLNPDGLAADTRGNARGVDLNRNFPNGWQSLGSPGSVYFSGSGPSSEPESRIAAALIRRVRPTVGIWFHQHMSVVDTSEGPTAVERRFAQMVGLPVSPLTDYPGSVTGWENTTVPNSAFVVELPAGSLPSVAVTRYVAAVQAITR